MLIIVELIKLLFTISEGMNNLFILRIVDFSLSSGPTKEVYILPGNSNISFNRFNLENKPCIIQKTSFYDVMKRSLKRLMKQCFY